jgi:type 1 glutamine amidotransferase
MRVILSSALILAFIASCGGDDTPASPSPAPQPPQSNAIRVLMVTATAGFRHDSIDAARMVLASLASTTGEFRVTATEDLSTLTSSGLAAYDVLFFALTSGELPLSAEQRSAILGFVSGGGGFLGAHSATDTLYGWPEYGEMIGAYFREHPWTQQGTVVVEDGSHPAAAGVGSQFSINEEFYTFRENPRPRVQVLLRLDAGSVGASGDYPLAWTRAHGRGRVYYNALGHFSGTWQDTRFQRQLRGAIAWAAGR